MSTESMEVNDVLNKQIVQGLQDLAHKVAVTIESARHCCPSCLNFNQDTETCVLAGARPPARVIAHGCPSWEADIPF